MKCFTLSTGIHYAETRNFVKYQKLGSCEMWAWRRMERMIWTYRLKNYEVIH